MYQNSLLRNYLTVRQEDVLGDAQTWNWSPVVAIDTLDAREVSPTEEYSSNEGNESVQIEYLDNFSQA